MMTRRQFTLMGGLSMLASSRAIFAQQQGKVFHVGFLSSRARPTSLESDFFGGFPSAMRDLGYIENRDLVIDWRFADGQYVRLHRLASELVHTKVDVIVSAGTPSTEAARNATAVIPIVMISVGDPVGSGFVSSLARPGGNVTGLSIIADDLAPKLLEILQRVVPKLSYAAILMNSANGSATPFVKNVADAAREANIKLLTIDARTSLEIESAFRAMAREQVGAVIVSRDPLFTQQHRQIAELATNYRLPSISGNQAYAEAGGLMGYGSSAIDDMRRAALYVDKILKGAKPADLPVELPSKFEMIVNRKTARTLGIVLPRAILTRADRIVE